MKQALILGCSHAYGSEILPYHEDPRQLSYPAIIAQELGYTVVNLAIAGGSNDAMFRLFLEHQQSADLIIACWTGWNRSEVWNDKEQTWQALSALQTIKDPDYAAYLKQWTLFNTGETLGRLNKIKNIVALNSLAKQPVLNIDSFWPVDNFELPKHYCWPVYETFCSWCAERHFEQTDWGHFHAPAHKAFARYVLERVQL